MRVDSPAPRLFFREHGFNVPTITRFVTGCIRSSRTLLPKQLMHKSLFALAVLLTTSTPALAQQRNADPSAQWKDPTTATLLSLVIAGGGQYYSGETERGAHLLLAAVLGSVAGGAALASGNETAAELAIGYTGLTAGVAAWLYSIMDASRSAKRMNARNGLAPPLAVAPAPIASVPASPVQVTPSENLAGPCVAQRSTGELFWHECSAARSIGSRWRREYATLEEATKAGYTLSRAPGCEGPPQPTR